MATLEKMLITAYSDGEFNSPIAKIDEPDWVNPYTVWINPASYVHNYKILYNNRQGQGSNGVSPDFNRVGCDNISFDLTFDATGIVPSPFPGVSSSPSDGIAGMIVKFREIVLDVNSKIHSPNFVKLSWAQLNFQCRMESLNITYTLFMPDGTPLRAKASVVFIGYTSEQDLVKEAKLNSPDMTHAVIVVAGDTLPALCHQIYGSSTYYLRVAEANGLSDFRRLIPGSQLLFPPLSDSPQ